MSTRISGSALQEASRRAAQLTATRAAFDSVAADYDGPRGNNELIQRMREEVWRLLDRTFHPGSHLLDLGCGTGLDAVRMARAGHRVTATDWSPCMVERTHERAAHEGMSDRVHSCAIGAHELERFAGTQRFDGAYSNFGALNCVPELERMATECARLLRPGARLVFSVIGRICPWEMVHYLRRGQWARVRVRFARGFVRVSMNRQDMSTHSTTRRGSSSRPLPTTSISSSSVDCAFLRRRRISPQYASAIHAGMTGHGGRTGASPAGRCCAPWGITS